MIAHKVIEFIDSIVNNNQNIDINKSSLNYLRDLKKLIFDSVKFEIGCSIFENADEYNCLPKLPFDKTYFEFSVDAITYYIAVQRTSDFINGYVGLASGNFSNMVIGEFSIKETQLGIRLEAKVSDWQESHYFDLCKEIIIFSASQLCYWTHVMACSNITYIDVLAPEALNKKRLNKGKQPLFSYKTLNIKLVDKTANKNSSGVTHASPRVHLRRGHIRKLSNGNKIWVQPCVVGDKSKGLVHKDYYVSVH